MADGLQGLRAAAEAVRLVVWDLDETFWRGTVTEGGHSYQRDTHDIVIELARRGIVSSICSKNDFTVVKAILEAEGLWEFFVFPNISWEAKGPRLAGLVKSLGLRPQTVLFIDDNPANLAEARAFVPGLQTEAETFVPHLLDDRRFRGKDDRELSRLAQYRVLEQRAFEAASTPGGSEGFLRASGIFVTIEHDLEAHLDRAIELINRTNQLNYTKMRLPEDPEAARAELRRIAGGFDRQFGILRVRDRYGDHGYCGLYLMQQGMTGSRLLQFCFSCRILNMGVETWLYRYLGHPALRVRGEVLTDVTADVGEVDWITFGSSGSSATSDETPESFEMLYTRGGCELQAVSHYVRSMARNNVVDLNFVRDDQPIRLDHSIFIQHALRGVPDDAWDALRAVGYADEDFHSRFLDLDNGSRAVWLLSFWTDATSALYRHRRTGTKVPIRLRRSTSASTGDLTRLDPNVMGTDAALVQAVQAHFDFVGAIGETEFRANLRALLERAPEGAEVFILLANDSANGDPALAAEDGPYVRLNGWIREETKHSACVRLVETRHFIRSREEAENVMHFHREVYFRIFQHIASVLTGKAG